MLERVCVVSRSHNEEISGFHGTVDGKLKSHDLYRRASITSGSPFIAKAKLLEFCLGMLRKGGKQINEREYSKTFKQPER